MGIIFISCFFLILFLIHISEPLQHLLTPPSKYTQNTISVCSLVLPPLGPHRCLSGLGWDCCSSLLTGLLLPLPLSVSLQHSSQDGHANNQTSNINTLLKITNIRSETGSIAIYPPNIKWITRKFYEQPYMDNFSNLNGKIP